MATIIDSLLVELGLDNAKYETQMKKALLDLTKLRNEDHKTNKSMTEGSRMVADGFRKVRNELLGIVAAALGARGVKDFFGSMIGGESTLGRLAYNLGMSARELDAWGAAAETVGGSAQGMQNSLQSLEGGMESYKLGQTSPVVSAIRALNAMSLKAGGPKVSFTDAQGHMQNMRDLLLEISGALTKLKPQEQIKAAQMLGFDSGTLYLLRQGRTEVAKTYDQMYRASSVTASSVRASERAQRQFALMKREIKGVGQEIFSALTPELKTLINELMQLSNWATTHKTQIAEVFVHLSEVVNAAVKGISELYTWISKISDKLLGGTSIGDFIGSTTAKILAYGGDKGAQTAINNMNSQTHIGTMNIHTQATNANEMASGVRDALKKNALIYSGMTGTY